MALNKDSMDYNVPEYDIKSVMEIRKRIKDGKYKQPSEVHEHLQFLETMHNKLKRILEEEKRAGMSDLDTEKFFFEVKRTYDELYSLYRKLLEKTQEKKKPKEEEKRKKPTITGFETGSVSTGIVRR